ncbi:MAG: hypothetical protein ABI995_16100, partial [Acidobacteriota bacterium]
MVTLFGAGIGSEQPVEFKSSSAGEVLTYLGGLSVYLNGVAVPLYVSKNQINAVVPFETSIWLNTLFRNDSGMSEVQVPVIKVRPDAFRAGTGWVAGAGLMSPAAKTGSVGLGKTAVAMGIGATVRWITGGFRSDSALAEVVYAGDAPNLVQGVVQMNVRLPSTNFAAPASVTVTFFDNGKMAPACRSRSLFNDLDAADRGGFA